MSLIELYHLKNNPFALVPDRTHPFWADRTELKTELEEAIKFTLRSSQSQIIACIYGDWGCGKTHAMIYFSSNEILQEISEDVKIPKDRVPLSIPLIFPTKDVFKSLYLDVVYRNLVPRLASVLSFLSKQVDFLEREGNLEKKLVNLGINNDLAKVLSQFGTRRNAMLVNRYLTANASRADLDKLGVAKGIETNGEMLSTFTDLLKLFTKTLFHRVFIWIDDCERIDEIPGRELYEFQYFLRDVLDLTPEKLTLVLNFTQLPGSEVPERMTLLGPAVQDRIAKVIPVRHFDCDNFLKYIEDLIEDSRMKTKGKPLDKYFPYTETCLKNVYAMLEKKASNLQPRTVNRVLSALLEQGGRTNATIIDDKLLAKVKDVVMMTITS